MRITQKTISNLILISLVKTKLLILCSCNNTQTNNSMDLDQSPCEIRSTVIIRVNLQRILWFDTLVPLGSSFSSTF